MPDLDRSDVFGSVGASEISPSPSLLAAQRRLEQLRAARQQPRRRTAAICWPAAQKQQASARVNDRAFLGSPADSPAFISSATSAKAEKSPATVRIHPVLALAMLKAEQAAAGRIWLLLRFLDTEGRGWLPSELVRGKLTQQEANTRVCGRRQLRNLLRQGEGTFWEHQQAQAGCRERIWLRSPSRVATALGLERLTGRPVHIPLAALLGGIGQVRAHFYASFHHGRQAGDDSGAPISRARLATLTNVPPRTQRLYDGAAGIRRQANYAVGADYSIQNMRERAWRHGRAVFQFVDHQGRQGPAGRRYVAWRLPNSYVINNKANSGANPGKREINNRQPADLVTTGAQGNGRELKHCLGQSKTLFHPDSSVAGQAYNLDCSTDAYWPDRLDGSRDGHRPVLIWQVIGRSDTRPGGNLLPGL